MSRRLVVEADGGSRGNPGPAGFGVVVRDATSGEVLHEVAAGIGTATNNVAEYRGLIAGLQAAAEFAPASVEVRMDSKLVVEQMSGRWKVKHPDMQTLASEAARIVRSLPNVQFRHVPRERNAHADRLANEAMDAAAAGLHWTPGKRDEVPTPEAMAPNRLAGWMAPPSPPTVTWLLRHGATDLSADRRFCGVTDAPLTDQGRAQAQAAAARLASAGGIGVVVSSPLQRATQTAATVAAALEVTVSEERDLRETDFGAWEGRTFAEVQQRWPDELAAWLADPAVAPPGGESFEATERRVASALVRVLGERPQQTVLVVSHVTPIKLLLRAALQAPLSALYRMHLDPASLSLVDWYPDGPAVVRLLNGVDHLAGL